MHIRVLTAADAAPYQVVRLRGLRDHPEAFGSSYAEEVDTPLSAIEARLQDLPDIPKFGAFQDGWLIGIAGLRRDPRRKLRHRAALVGMYVIPEARGQGVGRALVAAVIEYARALGDVRYISLSVTVGNSAARSLYRACGFQTWGVEPAALYIDGRDHDIEHMILPVRPGHAV